MHLQGEWLRCRAPRVGAYNDISRSGLFQGSRLSNRSGQRPAPVPPRGPKASLHFPKHPHSGNAGARAVERRKSPSTKRGSMPAASPPADPAYENVWHATRNFPPGGGASRRLLKHEGPSPVHPALCLANNVAMVFAGSRSNFPRSGPQSFSQTKAPWMSTCPYRLALGPRLPTERAR